jgi:glycosyltransferase involved in cell wall biosynthesis
MMAGIVDLPEDRTFHVPHPSYVGTYPDFVTREQARSELRVNHGDDFVLLLFGALAEYKGVEQLQDAFEQLADAGLPRTPRLLIAGGSNDERTERALRVWAADRRDVVVVPKRVPVEDVQFFFRAADLVVLPYRRGLNSGAALLALSFGVPILASMTSGLGPLIDRFHCFAYDPGVDDGLVRALCDIAALDLKPLAAGISAQIPDLSPHLISDRFFAELFRTLGVSNRRVSP